MTRIARAAAYIAAAILWIVALPIALLMITGA